MGPRLRNGTAWRVQMGSRWFVCSRCWSRWEVGQSRRWKFIEENQNEKDEKQYASKLLFDISVRRRTGCLWHPSASGQNATSRRLQPVDQSCAAHEQSENSLVRRTQTPQGSWQAGERRHFRGGDPGHIG